MTTFQAKLKLLFFFLDKDTDDYISKQITCEHIAYTKYYTYENYLFKHGNIVEASADAAMLDEQSLQREFRSPSDWRKQCAELWKKWVVYCLFIMDRANRGVAINFPGYRRHSCINGYNNTTNPFDVSCEEATDNALNSNLEATVLSILRQNSSLTEIGIKRIINRISKHVDSLYQQERYDEIFNGKWYYYFLKKSIHTAAAGRRYKSNGLDTRITSCLLGTLNFQESWAEELRNSLIRLVGKL